MKTLRERIKKSKGKWRKRLFSPRGRKILGLLGIVLLFAVLAVLFLTLGKPLIDLCSHVDFFRSWVNQFGVFAPLAFIGMIALQIILAFLPGEPLELAAGLAFGPWWGMLVCLIGSALGSSLVFLLVRKFGTRLVYPFVSEKKLHSARFLQESDRMSLLLFLIFLIPGAPKDVLTYFVGLTRMNFLIWLVIATVGRIPSVITSTLCGDALLRKDMGCALGIGILTLLLALGGILFYRYMSRRRTS